VQGIPWAARGLRGAPAETALAARARALARDLAARARDVVLFSERHPEMSFLSGLEPVALEMRMVLAGGALDRAAAAAAGQGGPRGRAAPGDLDQLRRAADLGREAHRRLARYEAELLARPARRLGEGVETVFSVASSLVWIIMAIA